MHSTNPHTGEHCNCHLRYHWHVNGYAIPFTSAICFEDIRKFAHFLVQFAIANMPLLIRLVAFPDDCCLIPAGSNMPVKAISCRVQGAIRIPLDMQIISIIGYIADLTVGLYPVYALALLGPELVGISNGCSIQCFVGFGINMR